ncbi:hypothetical protein C3743_40325 [Burkholderia contaminans]|uniref:Uncharacterized protein n=1 Tax=Burkholderia contaminans TaxID=488447 RepID=A0A2S5DMB3_9BURK|nr:hypothetical protein C3743_40325 [Burkholderia contaminans]
MFHAAWGLDRDSSHYNKAAWQHVHQVLLATAGQHLDSQLLAYALRNAPQEVRSTLPVLLNKAA